MSENNSLNEVKPQEQTESIDCKKPSVSDASAADSDLKTASQSVEASEKEPRDAGVPIDSGLNSGLVALVDTKTLHCHFVSKGICRSQELYKVTEPEKLGLWRSDSIFYYPPEELRKKFNITQDNSTGWDEGPDNIRRSEMLEKLKTQNNMFLKWLNDNIRKQHIPSKDFYNLHYDLMPKKRKVTQESKHSKPLRKKILAIAERNHFLPKPTQQRSILKGTLSQNGSIYAGAAITQASQSNVKSFSHVKQPIMNLSKQDTVKSPNGLKPLSAIRSSTNPKQYLVVLDNEHKLAPTTTAQTTAVQESTDRPGLQAIKSLMEARDKNTLTSLKSASNLPKTALVNNFVIPADSRAPTIKAPAISQVIAPKPAAVVTSGDKSSIKRLLALPAVISGPTGSNSGTLLVSQSALSKGTQLSTLVSSLQAAQLKTTPHTSSQLLTVTTPSQNTANIRSQLVLVRGAVSELNNTKVTGNTTLTTTAISQASLTQGKYVTMQLSTPSSTFIPVSTVLPATSQISSVNGNNGSAVNKDTNIAEVSHSDKQLDSLLAEYSLPKTYANRPKRVTSASNKGESINLTNGHKRTLPNSFIHAQDGVEYEIKQPVVLLKKLHQVFLQPITKTSRKRSARSSLSGNLNSKRPRIAKLTNFPANKDDNTKRHKENGSSREGTPTHRRKQPLGSLLPSPGTRLSSNPQVSLIYMKPFAQHSLVNQCQVKLRRDLL